MNKKTVLIVEDEAIVAADLAAKLKLLGYELAGIASEGTQSVEMTDRLRPNLVLMDIRLKGSMDGIEAADLIRRRHEVPVIYLTAHSDAPTLDRAKLTGPFGYILKPFEERDLATQIELALYKHQADRKIREQREWLRVTLKSIGDAVIATDSEGRVTLLNPVAESLTGWKSEEAVGLPFTAIFRVVNAQTGHPLEEQVSRVFREGRALALTNHAALVTRDARTVPIEDSVAPILNAEGEVIGTVLVFHDVTEKRRAAEAQRQIAQFPEENPNPVMRWSIDGEMLYANAPARRWLAQWGWKSGDPPPTQVSEAMAEAQRQARTIEIEVTTPEGLTSSVFVVKPPGEKYVNLYSIDITERKRAEWKYRRLHDTIRDAFVVVDMQGGIRECNSVYWNMLGYSEEEVLNLTYLDLTPEKWHAAEKRIIEEQILKRGYSDVYEKEYRRKDGGVFPVELRTFLIKNNAGEPSGMWAILRDITERKRAEDALRLIQTSIDVAAEMVAWFTPDGRVRYANDATCRKLGYTREELIQMTALDFTPGYTWEQYQQHWGAIRQRKSFTIKVTHRRKDGSEYPAEVLVNHVVYGGQEYIFAYGRDITDRKQAEESLRESRELLEEDLEAMKRLHKIGMLAASEHSLAPVLGEIVDAAIAVSGADFGNVQILDREFSVLKIAAQRGFPEWWVEFWNRVSGGQGVCGTALERGERIIVEDVQQSPIFVKTPALEIQIRAGVRAVQSTPIVSRSGKPLGMFSTHYRRPHRPDDRVLRLLDLIARQAGDVIERAQTEEALHRYRDELELRVRERTAELEVSNKALVENAAKLKRVNEELEDFTSAAAHDLQEPLRKIQTFSSMLKDSGAVALDSVGKEYLDRVVSSINRMRQLINDLLQYSRVTTKPEPFKKIDLDKIVREVGAHFSEELRQSDGWIEVENMPSIEADGSQMFRLFQNLIGNGLKYRSDGHPRIKIYAKQDGGECEIFVKDNGIGFEQQYAERIFKPFQRLHGRKKYEGTGIGLAICRKIVERHGGSIRAESSPGKGSIFIVRLPVKYEERAPADTVLSEP